LVASFVSYCVCMKWFCCCEFLDEVSKSRAFASKLESAQLYILKVQNYTHQSG